MAPRSAPTGDSERFLLHSAVEAAMSWEFEAELWAWSARKELWVFATVPEDVSDEIADRPRPPSGFGAVRVRVRLGEQRWETSVFPGVDRGAYVLPIKKAVRTRADAGVGDTVTLGLELV
jgi:hypothetical protein